MEETQTINEKCRDFVDSQDLAKETEDEARKKLSESLEEEFEVSFETKIRAVIFREKRYFFISTSWIAIEHSR